MARIKNIVTFDPYEYGKPPEPTVQNPFAQLEWLFKLCKDNKSSPSTKSNYQSAKKFLINHIRISEGLAPYYIYEKWDQFALLHLKETLTKRIESGELNLKSYTLIGHFSAIRQAIKLAATYGLLKTKTIQDINWKSATSETDGHTSYSDNELSQIIKAIAEELRYVYSAASEYKKQSPQIGRDPRISPTRGRKQGYGFFVAENMRWYFENVLLCRPIRGVGPEKTLHRRFLAAASTNHGGLHNLYFQWGVAATVNDDVLMPLVLQLALTAALNPSSILGLKADCFHDEHPLTGMPYLLFEKERSNGENELHLPLLEKRIERGLKRKQTTQVKRAITTALKLTEEIRGRQPKISPLKNHLFIYETRFGKISTLTPKVTSAWCKKIAKKYDLRNDVGEPLNFNLVRFRPTKLTEMAIEGRDFFEIQQVARHKSISQTVRYIAAKQLEIPAQKTITKALSQICANHLNAVTTSNEPTNAPKSMHLFKGLIADCKNVFDPPDRVKRAVDYVPGQACTRFNMCLFCRNVVVLKEHLPALVAYRSQIKAIQGNNVHNVPHATLYDQTLSVLDNLLSSEQSPFTREEIEWAFDMATTIDIVVDPLLYQGVSQ